VRLTLGLMNAERAILLPISKDGGAAGVHVPAERCSSGPLPDCPLPEGDARGLRFRARWLRSPCNGGSRGWPQGSVMDLRPRAE